MKLKLYGAAAVMAVFSFGTAALRPQVLEAMPTTVLALNAGDIIKVSIYGDDDRKDFHEYFNSGNHRDVLMSAFATSVVSIWHESQLELNSAGTAYSLKTKTLEDKFNLREGEKFGDQPVGSLCSGSLVAEDTVMTAGHCLKPDRRGIPCEKMKVVFGFAIKQRGVYPKEIAKSEVYSCSSVIARKVDDAGPDYALIKLDKPVESHQPIAINRGQKLEKGTELFVIGHPSGLPVKISGNARIRKVEKNGYFVTDLDTFVGNSGSPVFNAKTFLIEGILVRGATDYAYPNGDEPEAIDPRGLEWMYDPGKTHSVKQDEGRGEDATKVSEAESFIKETDAEKKFKEDLGKALKEINRKSAVDSIQRTRTAPAIYLPDTNPGRIEPAIYYPDPEEIETPVIKI
ncbi:MAG: trypsin-like peptidase domain-containing protein [Elusimicrobia bacterium]|nr:trypsin-like peptidase domain-containing protein [Elusimicrobiota bacterium]